MAVAHTFGLRIVLFVMLHWMCTAKSASLPATPCDGVCVESYLCENNTVLVYGEGLIDIRIGGNDGPRYCEVGEECCTLNDYDDSAEYLDGLSSVKTVQPIHRCGVRSFKPSKTSHQESTSQFGEFPWMMAVLQSRADPKPLPAKSSSFRAAKPSAVVRFDYRCGGSLIHPQAVLTAAHCVDAIPYDRLFVRAGEWDTRRTDEPSPHQNRQVYRTIVHPDFNSRTISNDIAVLKLVEPVRLASHINTICLPLPQLKRFQPSGRRCFVSGWGKDKYGGRFQAVLKRVSVPLVDRATCQRALRRTGLGRHFRLHQSFLCAGGERGDSCRGDGGSPLVCPTVAEKNTQNESAWPAEQATNKDDDDDDLLGSDASIVDAQYIRSSFGGADDATAEPPFYQAGIVSWGIGCNEQVPAAYVNVASFRAWIDGVMARNGWDARYYTAA